MIRLLNKTFDTALFLLLGILFFISVYALYDSYLIYTDASMDEVLGFKPTEGVMEVNAAMPDALAWITIYDTGIDYPLMQGENNLEYLNKDPFGAYSLSGSIFLDFRCDISFTDPYSLIYGHHMEYKKMFGALDDFKDEEFFEKHREGELITLNGTKAVELFAVSYAQSSDELFFNPSRFDLQELKNRLSSDALIYTEPGEGNIIALSTCQDSSSTKRLIVLGTLKG